MAFNDTQLRQLKAKLDPKNIKSRQSGRITLHYVEGWHAIAEANRIFGFDGWDRETISISCLSSVRNHGDYVVAYSAKVRITARAGEVAVVREGSGAGEAFAATPGQAHELALKSAETDATKRALASFGNSFGLALYDPDQGGIKGAKLNGKADAASDPGPCTLYSADGEAIASFDAPKEFESSLRLKLNEARSVDDLFALWRRNVETVRSLHRLHDANSRRGVDGTALVAHLKLCARRLGEESAKADAAREQPDDNGAAPSPHLRVKIDKSRLTISEPKRIRSKEHLRFVAKHPCLICGRSPSHAHHVRYAQSRGLALKVSDEFTVPLCAIHHSDNHSTGDERRWWRDRKIDPLAVAADLWSKTAGHANGCEAGSTANPPSRAGSSA